MIERFCSLRGLDAPTRILQANLTGEDFTEAQLVDEARKLGLPLPTKGMQQLPSPTSTVEDVGFEIPEGIQDVEEMLLPGEELKPKGGNDAPEVEVAG